MRLRRTHVAALPAGGTGFCAVPPCRGCVPWLFTWSSSSTFLLSRECRGLSVEGITAVRGPHPAPERHTHGIELLSSASRKQTLLEAALVQPGWLLQEWNVYQFLVSPLVMDSLSPAVKHLMQNRYLELDKCPDEPALKAAAS